MADEEDYMKKIIILFILIFIGLCFNSIPTPVLALESSSPAGGDTVFFDPLISHIGGYSANAVLVEGDHAYIGMGPDLTILDITNPNHPTLTASLHISGTRTLEDIEKRGNHLFVIGASTLFIINVADLNEPILMGSNAVAGYDDALSLALSGNYAYIGYRDGLRIVDITEPSHPVAIDAYPSIPRIHDIVIIGNYAYLALAAEGTVYSGLLILDISTPSAIVFVNVPTLQPGAMGLAIVGNYVYLAQHGLHIVDISDPSHPTEVGYCACHAEEEIDTNITVQGHYAYVSNSTRGLLIIDIADPTQPVLMSTYDPVKLSSIFQVWNATVAGNYAYVTVGIPAGIDIVDISNPTAPVKVGDYNVPGQVWDVAIFNNFAYVADIIGLHVIDISDPAKPTQVGSYKIQAQLSDIQVNGQYVYIVGVERGLWIMDVSDPFHPTEVSYFHIPTFPRRVTVVGDYAYIADVWRGVHIIDVSNPKMPTEIGLIDTEAGDVTVVGRYAYVTHRGLQIFDISDPKHPSLKGEYSIEENPPSEIPSLDVTVIGNYAYLAAKGSLHILDVSDPTKPTVVGTVLTPLIHYYAIEVGVSGNYVYVADSDGINIFDVSDPATPKRMAYVGFIAINSIGYGFVVAGNYVYAGSANGLYILRSLQEVVTTSIAPIGGNLSASKGNLNLIFPSGAFTKTTDVTYKHLLADENTGDLRGVNATFQLTALEADTKQRATLAPDTTYTITFSYTNTNHTPIIENTLALYYRDNHQWVKAPTSVLDMSNKMITATSNQLTFWAVLGETKRLYLPVIFHD
jgi:hypothetical protein